MKAVAIHQPEYLPTLGYCSKAKRADVFVLLDDVQFKRDSLQQRAKLADHRGLTWLTIPFMHKHPQKICDVQFADPMWDIRHIERVQAIYGSAPEFEYAIPMIRNIYMNRHERVVDAVIASVLLTFGTLGVAPEIVRSSSLGIESKKGDLVLDICRRLGATKYISGRGGASYLSPEAFKAAGIEIEVRDYVLPIYRDRQPEYGHGAGLSSLDAIAHIGEKAKELL